MIPKINDIIQLKIDNLGSSGEGVGSFQQFKIFVDGALPEEEILCKISLIKPTWGKAELLSILKPSQGRVTPRCPVFSTCGGCQLMHLNYEAQLKVKEMRVRETLKRIGEISDAKVFPCLPSERPFHYRNKIQLPVKEIEGKLVLGLYQKNSHEIVPIEQCFIHREEGEEILKELNALLKESSIKAWNQESHQGELRHVILKAAHSTNEALLIFVTNGPASSELKEIGKALMSRCPSLKGVVENRNRQRNNVILGDQFLLCFGRDHIWEDLGDIKFKVSPQSFFQVNPTQAIKLYQKALEFAEIHSQSKILDLYCGVGTLTLFAAKLGKEVIGVECVNQAIVDAKENAKINQITNCQFFHATSESFISNNSLKNNDIVFLNPPRKGCEPEVLQKLIQMKPQKIVYISCDPATLARDLKILGTQFETVLVQPVDMFPQTSHVECVTLLMSLSQ